jgi:septin family protein
MNLLVSVLLTGQSGLGKSTLMNTLFKSKVSRKSALEKEKEKIPKTVEIKSISHGNDLSHNPSDLPKPCLPLTACSIYTYTNP